MQITHESVSNQGERVLAGDSAALIRSHRQRYEFALNYICPSDLVLECACGSGYGSEILAEKARNVRAFDLSEVAVRWAKQNYSAPNVAFEVASAYELPIADASVDTYISFETIEHVEDPSRLLREANRVLKPGGYFIVSTPNRVVNGLPAGTQPPYNPFHFFEWSLKEFDQNLRQYFSQIEYFGQRVRSPNKFHPKYVESKFRRFFGAWDLVRIPASERLLEKMENTGRWHPENFLGVAKKPTPATRRS